MSQHTRIFIVGHPGAGKGLLAKKLAKKLNWQFVNIDFELEIRMGQSISKILSNEGEKEFASIQNEILGSLQSRENIVITTDASIVDHEENRLALMKEFVVNLQVSIPV